MEDGRVEWVAEFHRKQHEGTDLELAEVEPYADQWYWEPTTLDAAMVYLAKLTRR